MAENILIVDDEQSITDLIEIYLKNENYRVFKFYNGEDALKCIEKEPIDLAILDIMLPDINGFSICRRIREEYTFPVIMLTAKDDEMDKINGLTLGADDYITKPFKPLELVARVKAQLRRYKKYNLVPAQNETLLTHSGLVIDINTHECWLNERPISLTPTEFSILRILCEQKGNVVSAEKLFREIWGDEYFSKSNNTITVHIRHLREKMQDSVENPKYIKTVWGVGYKIEK
jgi:two-component system response regulator VanR